MAARFIAPRRNHDPLASAGDRIGGRAAHRYRDFPDISMLSRLVPSSCAGFCAQRFDVLAFLTDDQAGARAVYRNCARSRGAIDRALPTDACSEPSFSRLRTDVLVERWREMLLFAYHLDVQLRLTERRNPVGCIFWPMAVLISLRTPTGDVDVAGLFQDDVARSLARAESAQRW